MFLPEKRMLTEAVGSFNHVLHKRREDIEVCKARINDLRDQMVRAVQNGEDITEINKQLVQQVTILQS